MRKTVANTVYSATSDLFVVKEILGHKNLSTTQQYLGVGFEKLQEAMAVLDECNFPYNTLHSQDKLKKGQVQKSFRRRKSAKKFLSMQKGKEVSLEKIR
jgi:integrase